MLRRIFVKTVLCGAHTARAAGASRASGVAPGGAAGALIAAGGALTAGRGGMSANDDGIGRMLRDRVPTPDHPTRVEDVMAHLATNCPPPHASSDLNISGVRIDFLAPERSGAYADRFKVTRATVQTTLLVRSTACPFMPPVHATIAYFCTFRRFSFETCV
ncbi:unnamed protein product, partial [Iphiclides podalirius]